MLNFAAALALGSMCASVGPAWAATGTWRCLHIIFKDRNRLSSVQSQLKQNVY